MSNGCFFATKKTGRVFGSGSVYSHFALSWLIHPHNVGGTTDKSGSLQRGWKPEGMPDEPKAAEPAGGHGVCLQII